MINIGEVVTRITQMEEYLDCLCITLGTCPEAFDTDADTKRMFDELIRYYTGGQWLKDFDMDRQGLLPRDLKRGVLSEDAVYNLLTELMKHKNKND